MTRKAAADPDPDPYRALIEQHWEAVKGMYRLFADRAPLIEFNVASGQIRAYPALEYIGTLSERTREVALRQYRSTVAGGGLMVFVDDASQEILRSYIFPAEQGSARRPKRKKSAPGARTGAPKKTRTVRAVPRTRAR